MIKIKTLAIIPARGGSKGIPRKNIKPFLGKPLIEYTIKLALSIQEIDKVLVSTDDKEIAEISKAAGAEVPFLRPEELAQDNTPSIPVFRHAISFLEEKGESYENILILEPTSPLRTKKIILQTIEALKNPEVETVVSAKKFDVDFSDILKANEDNFLKIFLDLETSVRRQDTKNIYLLDGTIYGVKRNILMDESLVILNPYKEKPDLKTKLVLSDPRLSIEIDNEEDWEYAEYVYKKHKNIIENES
ncbi:acylneuraminate cytidylyltransferase family protein [archaeon]|nr:acylneuraminate cytidylyltransferase family protein [archaeon]